MDRIKVNNLCKETLIKHGLKEWSVRISSDPNQPYLGICMHRDKSIIINAHHCDIHPDKEVEDTVYHECAHAIVGPGHGHDSIWEAKARELGCTNTQPCSHLDLPASVIDAIRSGNLVEIEVEEKVVTNVIRTPKYTVTRLQDMCPDCLAVGKKTVAKEKFSFNTVDKNGDEIKLITLECFHILRKVMPKATPFGTLISNGWKPEIANCKHEWTKNTCDKCGENKLFHFQVIGSSFTETALAMQKGAVIADDMGLGKTNQAIAVTKFGKYRRTMVVTKSAIKFQWLRAFFTWAGPDYMAQIITTSRDFLFPNMKVYIIPYDLLRRFPREKLHALDLDLIILDECQQIKNPDSSRTQETRKLIAANPKCKVIGLSGTPWKNRGSEFFAILNMVDPIKFPSYQGFLDTWVEYYYEGAKRKMGGIRNIKKFKEYTAGLVIRREYEEVMDEFPTINRTKMPVQLDAIEQTTYDEATSDFVAWYNDYVMEGTEDSINSIELLGKMSRMRHVTGLAKIPATLGFLERFVEETDKKIVVFVHHKDVGVLMYNALTNTSKESNPDWWELAKEIQEEGVKVYQYTSQHTGKPEGYQIQEDFNNTSRCIMIASTLACGEGLNLQTCADSLLHERQWNPQNEDQATPGRFRRIGQKSNVVNITLPEAEGTIDEHLDYIVEGKRGRYHVVMNKGEVPQWNESEFARELASLIVKKYNEKKGNTISNAAKILKAQTVTQQGA